MLSLRVSIRTLMSRPGWPMRSREGQSVQLPFAGELGLFPSAIQAAARLVRRGS